MVTSDEFYLLYTLKNVETSLNTQLSNFLSVTHFKLPKMLQDNIKSVTVLDSLS